MKRVSVNNTKYTVASSNRFNKQLKKAYKQGRDIEKLINIVEILANGETLDAKYKDHPLINDGNYSECRECHIEPDWLLVYKIKNNELVLLLFATGSHSELFR